MKLEMCSIVVSPLVSVTRDQVLGFSGAAIGFDEEYEEDEKAARGGKCDFFSVVQRLGYQQLSSPWRMELRDGKLGRQTAVFAVDEGK